MSLGVQDQRVDYLLDQLYIPDSQEADIGGLRISLVVPLNPDLLTCPEGISSIS